MVKFIAIVFVLVLASCTTDQGARFARAWHASYFESSGSFDSHGGWKTGDDVARGSATGDTDSHGWMLTFDVGEAFAPDPDAHATRLALEQVLRARAEEPPKNVVPDEPPAHPVQPPPPAQIDGPRVGFHKLDDGRVVVSHDGVIEVLDPYIPHDLPFVESREPAPLECPPAIVAPPVQHSPWWIDPTFLSTVGGLLAILVGGKIIHKRRKRRKQIATQ